LDEKTILICIKWGDKDEKTIPISELWARLKNGIAEK
jgi:hypothetical protein